jgi:predicted NAD-dependent protein-ADP-ribosyltransferase YbiA (DUF1768 family)
MARAYAGKLFFHSASAPVAPGHGRHETIYPESLTTAEYSHLANNPHWRRALSNFWVSPFTLDGHRWNTVEHYFQAKKLALGHTRRFEDTDLFPLFCLDATPETVAPEFAHAVPLLRHIATADGRAARSKRKLIFLTGTNLEQWDAMKDELMAQAQFAKFSQCPTLRAVLLATGDAELWHGAARTPPARMLSLERVRSAIRAGATSLPELDED